MRTLPFSVLADEGLRRIMERVAHTADVHVSVRSLVWNSDLVETLELDNMLPPGPRRYMSSALHRQESRRCPFCEDFPERFDVTWMEQR